MAAGHETKRRRRRVRGKPTKSERWKGGKADSARNGSHSFTVILLPCGFSDELLETGVNSTLVTFE